MLSSPYPGLIISSIGCGGCEVGSTSRFDHLVDFFRRGEDHGGAVTQHARWHDRRCAAYRPVLARVGHEAQVAFPKGACLAIGGFPPLCVAAIGDCLLPFCRLEAFLICIASAPPLSPPPPPPPPPPP